MKKLAEQLFELQCLDLVLYESINKILGFHYTVTSLSDCWVDAYDKSCEIVLVSESDMLTTEQLNSVLELGFDRLFISLNGECFIYDGIHELHRHYNANKPDEDHWKFLALKYKRELEFIRDGILDLDN